VPLLKSLFCFLGYDNRKRYAAIIFSSYFIFILTSAIFSNQTIMASLFLILFSLINTLTTKRRLYDAQLNKTWIIAPNVLFFFIGLFIIFSHSGASYWLLLIPILLSSLLLTYKANKHRNYMFGYNGPIDLTMFTTANNHTKSRVEPTFQQSVSTDPIESNSVHFNNKSSSRATINESEQMASLKENSNDIGEIIRLKLFSHKNAIVTLLILVAFIFLGMISTWVISSFKTVEIEPVQKTARSEILQSQYEVSLPDNFSLLMSKFEGGIIRWQGEEAQDKIMWQQATAQGDSSCSTIVFKKGDKIRTLSVKQDTTGHYFAYFSPLDSKVLIKNIAFKGNFSLCGYTFSLKGSQAALGKHPYYADKVEY
jgi:hypothetical protein